MSLRFKCNVLGTNAVSPLPPCSILIPLVQLSQQQSALTVNLLVDEFLARFSKKFPAPVHSFLGRRNLQLQALLPNGSGSAGAGGSTSGQDSSMGVEGEMPDQHQHTEAQPLRATKLAPLGMVERITFPEDLGNSEVEVDLAVNGDDPLECFISLNPGRSPGSSSIPVSIFFSEEMEDYLFQASTINSSVNKSAGSSLNLTPISRQQATTESSTPRRSSGVAKSLHYSTPPPSNINSARGGTSIVRQDDQAAITLVQERGVDSTADEDASPSLSNPYALPFVPRPPRNSSQARGPASTSMGATASGGGEASGRPSGGGRKFMGASQVVASSSNPGSRANSPHARVPRNGSGNVEETDATNLPVAGGHKSSESLAPSEMRDLSPYSPIKQLEPGTPSRPQPQHVVEAYSPINVGAGSSSRATIVTSGSVEAEEEDLRSVHKAIRFSICTEERKARRILNQHFQSLQAVSPVKSPPKFAASPKMTSGGSSPLSFTEQREVNATTEMRAANPLLAERYHQRFRELLTLEAAGRRDVSDFQSDSWTKFKEVTFMEIKKVQLRQEKELKDIAKTLRAEEGTARETIESTASRKHAMYIRSFENGLKRLGSS